jgi:hypothetical protein
MKEDEMLQHDAEQIRDCLLATRALLSDPEHWCQKMAAQDKYGNYIYFRDPDAKKWCLAGAVFVMSDEKRYNKHISVPVKNFLEDILVAKTGEVIETWNDAPERSHQDVLDILDKAIFQIENDLVSAGRILEDA